MEKWRDIPGYEGIYEASTEGRIRSKEGKTTHSRLHGERRWKQRIIKPKLCSNKKGRTDARVDLWKNGANKTLLVSRLVAMTWVDGYSPGLTVNHRDGNPLNNSAENLEWVTRSENIQKGFEDGLYCKNQKPVRLVGRVNIEFESMAEASRFLGRNDGYVNLCHKRGAKATSIQGEEYRVYEVIWNGL